MNRKQLEEKYLRAKYEYYILCQPTMLDSDYDKLENDLKRLNSKVVELVDFPTVKEIKALGLDVSNILDSEVRDEKKYAHLTPMLSLQKIQVNNELEMPYHEYDLFLNRVPAKTVEATSKYDGNGQELIYRFDKVHTLSQALTRGDKTHGFDKTNKMSYIVPNTLNTNNYPGKTFEIRGEVVIDVKLWEKRYSDPNKVDNARNYVAGVLNRDEYNINTLKDLCFIAYSLVVIDEKTGEKTFPTDTMTLLKELGFNKTYEPLIVKTTATREGFLEIYKKFKEYRDNICPYLLDGIVIKFDESFRLKVGENNHHPKWAVAIKFPSKEVSTYIIDIEWKMAKTGELTPLAILEKVELDGSVVGKASLSNLGTILKKGAFPGAKVAIKKAGEIIPMITGVLIPSPNEEEYRNQVEEFKNK